MLFESDRLLISPTSHPSGATIGVVRVKDAGSEFLVVDVASGAVDAVDLMGTESWSLAEPAWSDDGEWFTIEGQPTADLAGMTVLLFRCDRDGIDVRSVMTVDPIDSPAPKAACNRFAPARPTLAYVYTSGDDEDLEIRTLEPVSGQRQTLATGSLNDPRWSVDGNQLLAARQLGPCTTDLVLIDVGSGALRSVVQVSTGQVMPVGAAEGRVYYIEKPCSRDGVANDVGTLWATDEGGNKPNQLATNVMVAQLATPEFAAFA